MFWDIDEDIENGYGYDDGKRFIPVHMITCVDSYAFPMEMSESGSLKGWKDVIKWVYGDTRECTCDDIQKCQCIPDFFPSYVILTRKDSYEESRMYLVHPDEKEHMERYLAGTDDPLYDLVHELRFNPQFCVVKETGEQFETKKQKL